MRERVMTTFIIVVLLVGVFIGAAKIYTDISVNKALITFNQAMNKRDYETANKLYLNYIGRSRFRSSASEITSKAGRDAVNLMTSDYAGLTTCEESRDTLNSIKKMSYSPTPAERELMRNSFNALFSSYFYENDADKQEITAKLNIYTTLNEEEFFYEDKDFFEKCFNDILSGIDSQKLSVDEATAAYSLLSPVYPESWSFVADKLNSLYTAYNEEKTEYQSAADVYTAIKNSGMAKAVAETNLNDLNKLHKSKTAFYKGVDAMNSADYLTAYRSFDEVKEFDLNFEQKNAYYNEMLPKAKAAAISAIEADCAAHEFAAARQVITDYDKYLDSGDLRSKSAYIDSEEEHYNKMLEAMNALAIHEISVDDGAVYISFTNKSGKTLESAEFTLIANGETASAVYAGEYASGEDISGEPDNDTVSSSANSAEIQSVMLVYSDGSKLVIDEEFIPYTLN